ncbi:MAG: hypothetical protein NTW21_15055 [Verrucomicrobia bacterium]|nr:hypothetical protein [Verrucomicrobiota bacterium]
MKTFLPLLACVLFVGCDFTVPLVETPTLDLDHSVLGAWEKPKAEGGPSERLVVLPLGKQEYLVAFTGNGNDWLYARGCLCKVADLTLVQLKWLGDSKGKAPDDARVFQFASFTVSGDHLSLRLLDPALIGKDVKSTALLTKAIADHKANPALFREAMAFTKAKD